MKLLKLRVALYKIHKENKIASGEGKDVFTF